MARKRLLIRMEIDIDRLHKVKLGGLNHPGCGHTYAKCVDLAHLIMAKVPEGKDFDGQIRVLFPTENFRDYVLITLEKILNHFDIPYQYSRKGSFLAGYARIDVIYPRPALYVGLPPPDLEFFFNEQPPSISEAPYFRVGALGEVYQNQLTWMPH